MDKQLDIWYNKKWNKICMDDIFLSNNKIYKDKVLNIIKVIFKNKTFSIHKNTFLQKKIKGGFISKIKILKNFFNKVINKYPEINCSIYIILNDHVTSDKYYINKTNINIEIFYDEEKIKNINNDNKIYNKLNNYPFFSFVKPEKSNFICIPDTIFLKDYSKNDRDRNLTNNCIKNTLEKIQDYNINSPWDKKNNNFIFKSEYSKYNEIKNILNKIKIVNCNDNYIDHKCIVEGDNKYRSIACASVIAKVNRDNYIKQLCEENHELKEYDIHNNKGYGTARHLAAIKEYGITKWHRKTFGICKEYC